MTPEDRLARLQSEEPAPEESEWRAFSQRAHGALRRRRLVRATAGLAVVLVVAAATAIATSGDAVFRTPDIAPADPPREGSPAFYEWAEPVEVWFVQGDRLYLSHQLTLAGVRVPEGDEAASIDGVAATRDAIERVLAGVPGPLMEATKPSVATALPIRARLLGFEIVGGEEDQGPYARVDLSDFPGRPGERFEKALAQVVMTATQTAGVERAWVFEKGRPVTPAPISQRAVERLLPPIVVTWPPYPEQPQEFQGEITLQGTANVFEGTVLFELTADGRVLADGFTTATCGSGCRGTFAETISFDVAERTNAGLYVFTESAEDGSRQDQVVIPVVLLPDPGAETQPPAPDRDPCRFLSPREVERATRAAVTRMSREIPKGGTRKTLCVYASGGRFGAITVYSVADGRSEFERLARDRRNVERVRGVGDRALIHGRVSIGVLEDGAFVGISTQLYDEGYRQVLTRLARLALRRL